MDGLRQLSQQRFQRSQNFRVGAIGSSCSTFEMSAIRKSKTWKGTVMPSSAVPEVDLAAWAAEDAQVTDDSTGSQATLKIVRLAREQNGLLNVSQPTFGSLVDAIRADPASLYMVSSEYDGFHSFQCAGYLPTWFVGTADHALLWTFDPARLRTVVIYMRRRQKLNSFSDICGILRVYTNYIHVPHLMFLVLCLQQQHAFDIEMNEALSRLHHIEKCTGFGPWKTGAAASAANTRIDELKNWSQVVGEISSNIANRTLHQSTSSKLLAAAKEAQLITGPCAAADVLRDLQNKSLDASLRILSQIVPILETQMATFADYLAYLQHRTERLSSVLFILLTHSDARASVKLAADSKRDSSSMKTIAIMTMAFLPGTFFAALFAMPSLKWDQPKIIQSNFWVFWAFTLPITALVFAIWMGIMKFGTRFSD